MKVLILEMVELHKIGRLNYEIIYYVFKNIHRFGKIMLYTKNGCIIILHIYVRIYFVFFLEKGELNRVVY